MLLIFYPNEKIAMALAYIYLHETQKTLLRAFRALDSNISCSSFFFGFLVRAFDVARERPASLLNVPLVVLSLALAMCAVHMRTSTVLISARYAHIAEARTFHHLVRRIRSKCLIFVVLSCRIGRIAENSAVRSICIVSRALRGVILLAVGFRKSRSQGVTDFPFGFSFVRFSCATSIYFIEHFGDPRQPEQ